MKNILLVFFAGFQLAFAQSIVLKPLETKVSTRMSDFLKEYEVLQLDASVIAAQIDGIPGNTKDITIRTPQKNWHLQLFEYSLIHPGMPRLAGGPGAMKNLPFRKDFRTFSGYIVGKPSSVNLSLADGFLNIMIDDGKDRYYIEPLQPEHLSPDVPKDQQFLLYKTSDLILKGGLKCSAVYVDKEIDRMKEVVTKQNTVRAARPCRLCVDLKICLAADYTEFRKYGTIAATENMMMSNIANMQSIWDDEFQHEYQLSVTGTFVADDQARDPFNGITDINAELTRFNALALNTLFPFSAFNLATLWSNKWTSTHAAAYQRAVCTAPNPYSVCADFSPAGGNSGLYVNEQAHAFGHNFDMIHDAPISPDIMNPTNISSRTWSQLSTSYLNNYVNFSFMIETKCLALCSNSDYPVPDFAADVTYGCAPQTVQFKDLSQYATTWKWSFPGGNPATSTLQNPKVIYSTAGTYEVSLETGNSRCDVSITKLSYITINDIPTADFSVGLDNKTVYFINQSQRGVKFEWKFGDGEFSDEENPTHEYPRDTTYEVTLKVTNDCGVKTFKKKINVVSMPVAAFDADTTGGCAPKIIKFTDKSTNNVIRWEWKFPGGNPDLSLQKNPFVRYDNPGVYDVELTVYSARFKNGLTKKLYIKIDSLPDAEFTYAINGFTVSFANQSKFAKSHFWDFGDIGRPNNTSADSMPSHTYLEGRYEVKYAVQNDCGTDTAKILLTIGAKPIAGFQVNNPNGCAPYTIQFTNTSTAAATAYRWYFPGGNPSTSTDKNPTVTYNTVGKFDVSLFAYNNFFSDSLGIKEFIEVKTEPTAAFTNVISGFKSIFTSQSTGATNYFWDFGDGQASFEENPVHDFGVEGEFDVKQIVQNECGLDTFEKHIAVYLVPKVNYKVDTVRGCAPLKVKFFDKSSSDVTDWEWQFEGGTPLTSTEKNPEITFNKKGRYTVKLTVKNTNGSNALTKQQYIQVLSTVLCPEHTKTKRFMFSDNPFGVNLNDRSNDTEEDLPLIYPNPANDYIYVSAGNEINPVNAIRIMDPTGKTVYQNTFHENDFKIQIKEFSKGSYFMKINTGLNTYVRKFIIAD
jgi:PKD repeat protein